MATSKSHRQILVENPHLQIRHVPGSSAQKWLKHAVCGFINDLGRNPDPESNHQPEKILGLCNNMLIQDYENKKLKLEQIDKKKSSHSSSSHTCHTIEIKLKKPVKRQSVRSEEVTHSRRMVVEPVDDKLFRERSKHENSRHEVKDDLDEMLHEIDVSSDKAETLTKDEIIELVATTIRKVLNGDLK